MTRISHFCLAILFACFFTLTSCDSGSEEEEGADTDPAIGCNDPAALTIPIDPAATYLRLGDEDGGDPAQALRLSDLGLQPGNRIRIERLGEFQFRAHIHPDSVAYATAAVFSSDDTLLDHTELARVPGALDAGTDVVTKRTFRSNLPTDIPEDFGVSDVDTLTIPDGAVFLFVSADDSRFGDNQDEDDDFRLCVTPAN